MTTGASVTVTDRIAFSAVVSPEQAAAYVREKLPGWKEKPLGFMGAPPIWIQFKTDDYDVVLVPMHSDFADYSRRMVELVDALVSLGCAQQPSQVLAAMAAIGRDGMGRDEGGEAGA